MAVKIFIGEIDITDFVTASSLKWNRYGTHRSDFSFGMEVFDKNPLPIAAAGTEVKLFDSSLLLWGGLINETEFIYRSENLTGIRIRCGGYEQSAARRSSGVINIAAENAGAVASYIFQTYLSENTENGEGLKTAPDSFDSGGDIVRYTSSAARINKILDDIAGSSGFRWWVTEDKTFYFKANIPVRQTNFKIDLTLKTNKITDISFKEKTSEYRNVQIVLGKDPVVGKAINTAEIERMKNLYGSGEYSSIAVNRNILTEQDAENAAANILSTFEEKPVTAVFTTLDGGLLLFDRIEIKAPRHSLYSFTPFVITEINARLISGRFVYTVTARKSGSNLYRPHDSWLETFGQLIQRGDSGIQGSPSCSPSGDYLKAENLIAGENITLQKDGKFVTVNASTESILKRARKITLLSNGMRIKLENDKVITYSYTVSSGNITKITDDDGFTTEIAWNT